MISGTVEHEVTSDDNIQNYVLVGEPKFAVKLCELAEPLE